MTLPQDPLLSIFLMTKFLEDVIGVRCVINSIASVVTLTGVGSVKNTSRTVAMSLGAMNMTAVNYVAIGWIDHVKIRTIEYNTRRTYQ